MHRILFSLIYAVVSALIKGIGKLFKRKHKDKPPPPAAAVLLLLLFAAGCCNSAPAPTPRRPEHAPALPTEVVYQGQRWTWHCRKDGVSRTVREAQVWVGRWEWVDERTIEVSEMKADASLSITWRAKLIDGVWVAPAK